LLDISNYGADANSGCQISEINRNYEFKKTLRSYSELSFNYDKILQFMAR